MTSRQQELIDQFLKVLPQDKQEVYGDMIRCLIDLGYIPQKQKVKAFVLSFKHGEHGKTMAKMGIEKQKGFVSVRFFACKNPPQKFMDALRREHETNAGRYSRPVPRPDPAPLAQGEIMKQCTLPCSICSGGQMRYYHPLPDGSEIFRCGAYPVVIPDMELGDVEDFKRVVREQHGYFQALA